MTAVPPDGIELGELTQRAALRLKGTDTSGPRHMAIRLWADLQYESIASVMQTPLRIIPAQDARRYLHAAERVANGEPVAYVVGWTGFRHLVLKCDRRALIPRPETETLVEEALKRVSTGTAADIGTGTGAIALSLRKEGAFTQVIGIDLSADAIALARSNGTACRLEVDWRQGNLLEPLRRKSEMVDLLISNPPYLTESEFGTLDHSVRDFEPSLALVSGMDGMNAARVLFDEGRHVVKAGGWLAMEIDSRRAADATALAITHDWQDVLVCDDLFGRARCLLARRGNSE